MQRDINLFRDILIKIRDNPGEGITFVRTLSMSESARKFAHHLDLLCDVGYVVNDRATTFRLTNQGHDFLDSINDKERFSIIKSHIAKMGGDFALPVVEKVAMKLLESQYLNLL